MPLGGISPARKRLTTFSHSRRSRTIAALSRYFVSTRPPLFVCSLWQIAQFFCTKGTTVWANISGSAVVCAAAMRKAQTANSGATRRKLFKANPSEIETF